MPCILCHHIKPDGVQCGSPALRQKRFCYHHSGVARRTGFRLLQPAPTAHATADRPLRFNPLHSREAIQHALGQVLQALALNRIDTRRASALLYGLQVATANAGEL